ncbi:MAG: hypothetical protein AAF637_09640 [Pseudomonadota bacterium]
MDKPIERLLIVKWCRWVGRVMWLLSSMPRGQIYQNRAFFEMVFDLLATDDPNLLLAAELRAQLVVSSERSTRLGRLIVGKVPVQSVVLGLLSTLLVLFVAILLLDLSQAYLRKVGQDPSPLHPLAQVLLHMPIEQIIILIVAAFMGAVVSVLSRLHSIRESSRTKPLLVYLTVATKPLVSIAFATFIYAIIGSGFIAVSSVSLSDPSVGYMVWSIGFLSGFSERFVKDFMGQADRIVAPGIPHVQSQTSSLTR